VGCYVLRLGNIFPDDSKERSIFIFRIVSQFCVPITLEMKATRTFEALGRNYPTTWRNNSAGPVPQYENRFAINGES
jgi:hypothetical protein